MSSNKIAGSNTALLGFVMIVVLLFSVTIIFVNQPDDTIGSDVFIPERDVCILELFCYNNYDYFNSIKVDHLDNVSIYNQESPINYSSLCKDTFDSNPGMEDNFSICLEFRPRKYKY